MNEQQLNAIRQRAEATTKGPWYTTHSASCDHIRAENGGLETGCLLEGNRWHDAQFIAHARQDVPALLAEVERLREIAAAAAAYVDADDTDIDALLATYERLLAAVKRLPGADGDNTPDGEYWPDCSGVVEAAQ